MGEYGVAEYHLVPESFVFPNDNAHLAIVIHKTGGDPTPESTLNTFMATMKSVHYVVGQDGRIFQCVLEKDGAGGNCCVETGYDQFWTPYVQRFGNLNRCTLSIEHCDPSGSNSTPLTDAQKTASFQLVAYLAHKYGISTTHIKGHFSIDPISRARCPGNYPWSELMLYLGGNPIVPNSPTTMGYLDVISGLQNIIAISEIAVLLVIIVALLIVGLIAIAIILSG